MRIVQFALLSALSATAMASDVVARPGSGPPGMMDPLARLEMMSDRLGLSETQEEQIGQLVDNAEIETAIDRERAHQIRERLHGMRGNFDSGRADALAQELGQITARLTYSRASSLAEVYAVLTPEQRDRLEDFRQRRAGIRQQFDGSKGGIRRGFAPD